MSVVEYGVIEIEERVSELNGQKKSVCEREGDWMVNAMEEKVIVSQ